jgi:tripartite-type tricarboxylate transporter receptor subunit TctC
VVRRINADLNEVLKDPQIRAALEKQGMTPAGGPPQALAALVATELPRWSRVVKAAGIRAD